MAFSYDTPEFREDVYNYWRTQKDNRRQVIADHFGVKPTYVDRCVKLGLKAKILKMAEEVKQENNEDNK